MDGSCYNSGASHFGVKVYDCRRKGIYNCKCSRKYSDPNGAMDNYPTYKLLQHYSMIPFIPLDSNVKYPDAELPVGVLCFDDRGVPICMGGIFVIFVERFVIVFVVSNIKDLPKSFLEP